MNIIITLLEYNDTATEVTVTSHIRVQQEPIFRLRHNTNNTINVVTTVTMSTTIFIILFHMRIRSLILRRRNTEL